MTILEPLQDAQLSEGQDAHFRCRLSRALGQEAHWALGGVPLQANEMNDITVEHGTLHLLTLHKVVSPDLLCPAVLPGAFPPAPPKAGRQGSFQLRCSCAGDLQSRGGGSGSASLTRTSLFHQVTLEDAGTISFQVGSCHSEAQLKVTGGQPPPAASLPAWCMPPCPSSRNCWQVLRPEI